MKRVKREKTPLTFEEEKGFDAEPDNLQLVLSNRTTGTSLD